MRQLSGAVDAEQTRRAAGRRTRRCAHPASRRNACWMMLAACSPHARRGDEPDVEGDQADDLSQHAGEEAEPYVDDDQDDGSRSTWSRPT